MLSPSKVKGWMMIDILDLGRQQVDRSVMLQ
jgi:hypothetical protein